MSAVMPRPAPDSFTSTDPRSVDELDAAIGRLVRQMNADSYRMLVLVCEFDDRFGWKKWSFKTCAEWLAWRSSISLSAAREEDADENPSAEPSREGFCTTAVQREAERSEVRETAAVYRLRRIRTPLGID